MGSEISKQTLGMSPFLDPRSAGSSVPAKPYARSPSLVRQHKSPSLVVPTKSMQKKAKFEKGQKGSASRKGTSKVQPHAHLRRLEAKANNQIKLPHKLVPCSGSVAQVKEKGKDMTKRFKKKNEVANKQPSHPIAIEKPHTTTQEGRSDCSLFRCSLGTKGSANPYNQPYLPHLRASYGMDSG